MRTITIPLDLMLASNVNWDIDWRGQSSGETNSGSRQIVYNAFPRWIGKPKMSLEGDQIGKWRAIRARAQGRHNVYRVPMVDPLSFDFDLVRKDVSQDGINNTANAPFSTGKGFQYTPFWRVIPSPTIDYFVPNPGSLPTAGSYEVWVDIGDGGFEPKIGGIYSINDFPFIATEVLPLKEITDPVAYAIVGGSLDEARYQAALRTFRLTVEMPLRTAVTEHDVVDLIAHGLFFAEDDKTGAIAYGGVPYSQPEFSFVEWLR